MTAGRGRWLQEVIDPGRRALRQALEQSDAPGDSGPDKERVWTRVQAPWAEPGRLTWRPLLLGAGVVAAVAAAALIVLRPVTLPHGVVSHTPPARGPEVVSLPSRGVLAITTGPAQRARQRLPRSVDAELWPRTALVPGDEEAPPEVRVGRVRFSVPHQAPGRRYIVRAGSYQVAVLGTTFVVAVEESGVSVAVESGMVDVQEAGSGRRLDRLEPGQRWSSEGRSRVRVLPPHPVRRLTLRGPAGPTDPAAAGALDEARQARRTDPGRALTLYQRLAAGRGPLAEIALYEMAAIENEDLRDPRRALTTWERYRERYPRGMLRAEADFSLIEVLTQLKEETRALEEARGFLRRYARSERRGEVALVAGDLARSSGDCELAVGLYDTAVKGPLGPSDSDDAAFNRAACLAAVRDGRAVSAAREYLARRPSGRHRAEASRLLGPAAVTPAGP
jgi:ferric-dicitrate binding protein FerR (iron transport regulator)